MAIKDPGDARLTHRIVVDSGQWAKGKTLALARAQFKAMHSGRNLSRAQVWAVTESTTITEHGQFRGDKATWVAPERLDQ